MKTYFSVFKINPRPSPRSRYTTPMRLPLLPPLRVHCWGGLGSQLFAWALFEDLRVKYPKRKMRLILHQSGVTKRTEEIAGFFPGECLIRADYASSIKVAQIGDSNVGLALTKSIQNLLVSLLYSLKLFSNCDADTNLVSVKFWTMQIRGHYSYRGISPATVAAMDTRARFHSRELVMSPNAINKGIAVQYRLGDLLTLGTKGPIHSARIICAIRSINGSHEISKVSIFSDSPDEALKRLDCFAIELVGDMSAWDTLCNLQLFQYFISTNSKISIWTILIRAHFSPGLVNFAPKEFEYQFNCNLPVGNQASAIRYY
jgi:hypothetical protein